MKNYFAIWRFDLGEGIRKIVQEENDEKAEIARLNKRDERNKTIRQIVLFIVFAIISLGMIFNRGCLESLSDRVTGALFGLSPQAHAGETAKGALNGAREETRRRNNSLDEIGKDMGGGEN
jgi:hypothetical protein